MLHLDERCYADSFASSDLNLFAFAKSETAKEYEVIPIGRCDDGFLSGNGLFVICYKDGDILELSQGIISSHDLVPLQTINVTKTLSVVLTPDERLELPVLDMKLSHSGRHLSIFCNVWNNATQSLSGLFVRLHLYSGWPLSVTPINPVRVDGFQKDLPAFRLRFVPKDNHHDGMMQSYGISQYGEALALWMAAAAAEDENPAIQTYAFKKKPGARYGELVPMGSFAIQKQDTHDIRYAVASDGATIAVNENGISAIHELRSKCKYDDATLHLTTNLDLDPDSVSWSVETVFRINDTYSVTHSIVEECVGCYESAHSYADARVVENICIPREMMDCVRLRFQIKSYPTETSFVAFFRTNDYDDSHDDKDIEPFAQYDSQERAPGHQDGGVVSLSYGPSDSCKNMATKTCNHADKESLLILAMTFERLSGGPVSVVVGSHVTGLVWENEMIATDGEDSRLLEICVPSNECGFSRLGEGSIQGLAYLMVIYNDVEVVGSGKGFGMDGMVTFGDCPVQ